MKPSAVGGVEHAIIVCQEALETAKAVEDSDSLVLRLSSAEEARPLSSSGTVHSCFECYSTLLPALHADTAGEARPHTHHACPPATPVISALASTAACQTAGECSSFGPGQCRHC